jgi:hypothetical protein
MLGEQVADVQARITSIRVLPQEGDDLHFEVCVQGTGTLLGVEVTCMAT